MLRLALIFGLSEDSLYLVALMSGFLAIVIFMIAINDKPFFGYGGIPADSYQLVLDKLLELPK